MEHDKSDLTSPLSVEKARAEDLSGLPSVFEEFENGVDIQPLDDIIQDEIQPFEDTYEEEQGKRESARQAADKKKRLKKAAITTLCIAAALCFAAFIGYNIFLRISNSSRYAVAAYQMGDKVEILLDNDKSFEISGVADAKLSKGGNFLIYSQNSATKTGKLDLRVIELKKRSSVNNKGTLAASGVEEGWSVSGDGAYIYYTLSEEDSVHPYAYITESKKSEPVAFDAEELFLPPSGDIVYFTRKYGQKVQLFRMRIGEKASVIGDVSGVKAFSDENVLEIFYTVGNDNGSYALYKVSGDNEPLKIASDVSEVYLDDYEIGGNLYYFVKSESRYNWSDFIIDSYADGDAEMEEPKKEDYTYTVGFIFKREKLDEYAYNQALELYERKQERDTLRQALNKEDLGFALSSEYKVKVFNGEKSRELASGVKLEDFVAFSKKGMPKIIVRKSGVVLNTKINLDELFDIASRSSLNQAMDYALQTLRNSGYVTNYGYKYIFFNGNNVYEYDFEPYYNADEATFFFGGKNSIFAAVRTDSIHYSIFYCKAENDSITPAQRLMEGATNIENSGDNILVSTASQNINDDLYICYYNGSVVPVCQNTVQYYDKGDFVVALSAKEDEAAVRDVELVVFKDGKSNVIDGGVYSKNIIVKNKKIAYIKNYEEADYEGDFYGGTFKIYEPNKPLSEINSSVSIVYDIN